MFDRLEKEILDLAKNKRSLQQTAIHGAYLELLDIVVGDGITVLETKFFVSAL
jgi:hypothetical protein